MRNLQLYHLLLLSKLLLLTTLLSAKTIYINENSTDSTSQGTLQDPYQSLQDAITGLDSTENVEIILLGDSVTIDSNLTFNGNLTFTIKPQERPQTGYFPVKFQPSTGAVLADVNVTFEGIQIVQLDNDRNINTSLFTVNRSLLCFNESLIANINYPNSYYSLIINLEEENQTDISHVKFINTLFENLTNVNTYIEQAHFTLQDCKFHNISMGMEDFMTLYTMSSTVLNITVINTTISDSKFAKEDAFTFPGFMSLFSAGLFGFFDGFTIRNCNFSNAAKVVRYSGYGGTDRSASFQILNTVLEDVIQDEEMIDGDYAFGGSGIVFDIISGNSVNVSNFTAKNINFLYQGLFRWSPQIGNLPGTQISTTAASFTNISITNSTNPNWLLENIADITWENITLENVYCNTTQIGPYPLLLISNGNSVRFNEVLGRNIFGPVFALLQVIYQEISNATFYNVTNSLDLDIESQIFMLLQRDQNILNLGLDLSKEMSTVIQNFHVYGFHQMKSENATKNEQGETSLIAVMIEFGTMSIEDSTWKNIEGRGFLGLSINLLNVDNLTVDTNLAADWRIAFQLMAVNQLSITNSLFQNNQNLTLIDLFNISRSGQYGTLNPISLDLENVTISNNTASPEDIIWGASSLISVISSNQPLQIMIKGSQFLGNRVVHGLIRSLESGQVSINVENSTFIENYASGNGAIFSLEKSLGGITNSLTMTGNMFAENQCVGNGGVMYLSEMLGQVISRENVFENNLARANGGVGYMMGRNLTYYDENSLYSGNCAEEDGSLIHGDFVDISFNSSQIENASESVSLINLSSGSISIENTSIVNISGLLLFDLKNVSGKFEDVNISEIDCSTLEDACLISGESVSLEFIDTEVSDVTLEMGELIWPDSLSEEILDELLTANITSLS